MTATGPALAPRPYRVVGRRDETADTAEIVLDPAVSALPPFVPGQFAMVYAFGVGDIPLSLSGIAGSRLTHTIRAVGAVSEALHCNRARRSAYAGRSTPVGTCSPRPDAIW